ncbi:MAG: glyoxalase/bleomycin resistance/dioxygenase family protein [Burkholderiaceae bacterium]|jgi:hypothetical protein|nr:glyoxalase/bleomycin resistance/dioxygenase family protein [Burkholderiaceae bacterium]
MKRLHVHVSVENLSDSIRYYSALFAAQPTVTKPDYAKWMLDDPRMNFAISRRGQAPGLDHLGIQAESAEELAELEQRLQSAELPHVAQPGSNCCYARSDKHWSLDPSGIAWEAFHTLDSIPTFGEHDRPAAASCCSPVQKLSCAAASVAAKCC